MTVFNGLPVHVLLVHALVVLVPLTAVLEMLCALWVDAVDFLVTDDNRLRRRGNRAGLADRIVTAAAAAELLEGLAPRITPPPPAVEALISYQLRLEDPIFDSLRLDYPDFDSWMRKARNVSHGRGPPALSGAGRSSSRGPAP